MKGEAPLLKELWQKLPTNYKIFAIILLIVFLISAFFTIYFFSDGVDELLNMKWTIEGK